MALKSRPGLLLALKCFLIYFVSSYFNFTCISFHTLAHPTWLGLDLQHTQPNPTRPLTLLQHKPRSTSRTFTSSRTRGPTLKHPSPDSLHSRNPQLLEVRAPGTPFQSFVPLVR